MAATYLPTVTTVKRDEKLESYENYFISWLGNSNLDDVMVERIENVVGPIKYKWKEDGHADENDDTGNRDTNSENKIGTVPKLKEANVHEEIESKNQEKLTSGGKGCDVAFHDDDDEESDSFVTSRDLQRAIYSLIEAFLQIKLGNEDCAKKKIALCTKQLHFLADIDSSIVEYFDGFDFLKLLLHIHMSPQNDRKRSFTEEFDSSRFENLSDKSKAIVLATKWMFLEMLDNRFDDALMTLKQVVALDPTYYGWNYVLCMRLRFKRRQIHGMDSEPDEAEINASLASVDTAVTLSASILARSEAGLAQTISEFLRWRLSEKQPDESVTFGNLTFLCNADIIKFLKRKARNALSRFPNVGFGEVMRYGEIFSTALPHEHRNYEIAFLCMTFCLRKKPTNSKANHKMGLLYLVGDKDVNEAIPYFRKSVEYGPMNYFACLDLIQSLLKSPTENDEEIEKTFEALSNRVLAEKQTAHCTFLHGCYLFMTGDVSSAIESWISLHSPISDYSREKDFQELYKIKTRYQWPRTLMNLEEVRESLQQADDFEKDKLKALEDEVTKAIDNGRRYENGRFRPRNENNGDGGRDMRNGNYTHYNDSRSTQPNRYQSSHSTMSRSPNTFDPSRRNNFGGSANGRYNGNNNARYDAGQSRRAPSSGYWR